MKRLNAYIALAVAVLSLAVTASSNAQVPIIQMNGIGSSALFQELGEAASASVAAGGLGASCVWNFGSNAVAALDSTVTLTETGNVWIAWTPTVVMGTPFCDNAHVTTSTQVYAYLQTDSTVGDRCLFNGCTVQAGTAGNPTTLTSLGTIAPTGSIPQTNVPSLVWTALQSAVTAAGTDIRPEDAEFATLRARAGCNATVAGQYLGLGYNNGDSIISQYTPTNLFHVVDFSLSSFAVTTVGAVPIVVAVNTPAGGTDGFRDPLIKNMNSTTVANYLDGTYSRTRDASTTTSAAISAGATVLLREPLSGTYNTMEYNVPNSKALSTSQDVGQSQPAAQVGCSGGLPINPLSIATLGGGVRNRVIGTGEMLNVLFGTGAFVGMAPSNGLGYAFWSKANFQGAPATAKYVTVDGVDPLEDTYTLDNGLIPTPGNGNLGHVTLAHVADGSYPITSMLRLVNLGGSPSAGVTNLANAAQTFVSFGSPTSRPDFVPVASIQFVHSHFNPPTVPGLPSPSNGTGAIGERGGDVGGVIYTLQGDRDYIADFQTGANRRGQVNQRK